MSPQVAPWLEDLDDDWVEAPSLSQTTDQASSVRKSQSSSASRIPRRSSGAHSVITSSTRRNPLKDLPQAATNADRTASNSSVVYHDSVKRSPEKHKQTLEWKKRLVRGEVGYGDQTDLFGPSGLENIFSFARPSSSNNPASKLLQHTIMPPSSPPPWPSQIESPEAQGTCRRDPDETTYSERHDDSLMPEEIHFDRSDASALRNRTTSGQTELSGEGFSPVFISKHTASNGGFSYAALDSRSAGQPSRPNTSAIAEQSSLPSTPHVRKNYDDSGETTLPSVPEVSLPDNLPTGTPPIPSFVSLKRTSPPTSDERPMSPSQVDLDHSFASQEAISPKTASPVKRPTTPKPGDESSLLSPPKSRPSQSPLKLFGNYDTFTNNRLFRRMSQLEGLDPDQPFVPEAKQPEAVFPETLSSRGRNSTAGSIASRRSRRSRQRVVSDLSSFGEGELDHHDFEADISFPVGLDLDATIESTEGSPLPEAVPPGSRSPFVFHLDTAPPVEPSPEVRQPFKLKRKLSRRSTAVSRHSDDGQALEHFPTINPYDTEFELKEGKRPQSSPTKAPTPKRRRTLVTLDGKLPQLGNGSEIQVKVTTDGSNISRRDMQPPSIAIHGPGSLKSSRRDATRPRNPTPSQRRREQLQAEISEATFDYLEHSPQLEAIKETLEELSELPPDTVEEAKAKAVAAEVAAYTFEVSRVESEGTRKRSITTQDFLDEAMHIMSLIRAKGRPHSGLDDVEESNAELTYGSLLHPEAISRPASSLRLERPPSREGASSGWRPRSQIRHNPLIASHLEQFREDDSVNMIESSLRSFHVDDSEAVFFEDEGISTLNLDHAPVIEPGRAISHSRAYSDASQQDPASPTKSHGSHPSIDSSTGGRTVGTTSSRKSDNVAMLSPEKVAHLIPEEVGGMTFDREQQRWVRTRHLKPPRIDLFHPPSNISSEDDPFGNIPDLTVDEIKELHRIQALHPGYAYREQSELDDSEQYTELPQRTAERPPLQRNEPSNSRPTTRDSNANNPFTSSTAPSKYSAFASSQQQIDTRATSWSNEELANITRAKQPQQQQVQTGDGLRDLASLNIPQHISEETEVVLDDSIAPQDESLLEGASQDEAGLQDSPHDDSLLQEDSETEELPAPKQREAEQQPWFQSSPQPALRSGTRQVSLRRQTFQRGFGATEKDQREVSFVATLPDKRMMSLSVSVSQHPHSMTAPNQEYGLSSPARMDGTFYLSDLPDFTVHDADEERPSERALARRVARHNSGDRYTMAVQSLVKTLTDVEPDEPYWEDIKQLNLREKGLDSIHNLEDFCARLEDLDLSGNNVSHLEGAPTSIRKLNLRSNSLSSLTAWSHMMNLQYLDISNNAIDNLGGLCMLIHLRELRADDNEISSLDGIMAMDGLLKLSVRHNQLSRVDFDGCQLRRLEDLNLSGNRLTSVSGVQGLPALERLSLDDNELEHFEAADDSMAGGLKITCLSLQKNRLAFLDVTSYTNLRYLNVDENKLPTIQGIEGVRHLETLSMRKQNLKQSASQQLSIFEQRLTARSLFLSSNLIPSLDLPHSYHSVQNLEIASCGLQELPRDFGLKFPNLRMLNVSFNAVTDLRSLLNITRLEKVHASGNRIGRLRKTVAVLARMPHLRKADLRDNPITHGFYAPVAVTKSIVPVNPSEEEPPSEAEVQQRVAMSHRLPNADTAADAEHLARLDEDTKLHRRVYEILLSNGCKNLESLDGLGFARDRALLRDEVWDRLLKLGVVRKSSKMKEEEVQSPAPGQ